MLAWTWTARAQDRPRDRLPDESLAEDGVRYLEAIEAAYRRAIGRAQPSVVSIFLVRRAEGIAIVGPNTIRPPILGPEESQNLDSPQFEPNSIGSGVVVGERGLVLTCFHVVRASLREPHYQIVARDSAGRRFDASLYAADPRSDLCVLQLVLPGETRLTPIAIGNGSDLSPGQTVIAIGNPFGLAAPDGATSASVGIVSNIRRRPAPPSARDDFSRGEQTIFQYGTLVQTDARLNMGVSGGALINLKGELIGVSMALAAAIGYETPGGFALPTDELTRRIIATLADGKEVEYGFIGIQPRSITAREAEAEGYLPVDGTYVERIFTFVPAYRNGLRTGDVITAINGQPIRNHNDLVLTVGSLPVGTVVDADVVRRKERLNLKIPLAKFGVNGDVIATNKRPLWNGMRVDHLSTVTRELPFGIDPFESIEPGGVVVREVADLSPASEKGIREGQIIAKVNGEPIFSPDEFEQKVFEATAPVKIQFLRGPEIEFGASEPSATPKPAAEADSPSKDAN